MNTYLQWFTDWKIEIDETKSSFTLKLHNWWPISINIIILHPTEDKVSQGILKTCERLPDFPDFICRGYLNESLNFLTLYYFPSTKLLLFSTNDFTPNLKLQDRYLIQTTWSTSFTYYNCYSITHSSHFSETRPDFAKGTGVTT